MQRKEFGAPVTAKVNISPKCSFNSSSQGREPVHGFISIVNSSLSSSWERTSAGPCVCQQRTGISGAHAQESSSLLKRHARSYPPFQHKCLEMTWTILKPYSPHRETNKETKKPHAHTSNSAIWTSRRRLKCPHPACVPPSSSYLFSDTDTLYCKWH